MPLCYDRGWDKYGPTQPAAFGKRVCTIFGYRRGNWKRRRILGQKGGFIGEFEVFGRQAGNDWFGLAGQDFQE